MYTEKWNEYSERYDIYHCGEFIGFVDKNNTYHDDNNGNAFFPHIAYEYDRYMKHYRTNNVGLKEGYTTLYGAKRALIEEYEKNTYSFKSKCTKKMNIRFLPLGDNADFFPTPSKLAAMMFAGIKDWDCIEAILEPSAGKGDLLDALDCFFEKRYRHSKDKDIDCIEIDENLRHILEGKRRKIVYDDFLKFPHHKKYHLILMNPPFSKGAAHLLKAMSIQKYGGQICCLLNAETLRKPCTNERKLLISELGRCNARIKYVSGAFKHAQRCSDVEVAIIWIDYPRDFGESVIIDGLQKTEESSEYTFESKEIVEVGDWIYDMISRFDHDFKIINAFLREYETVKPFFYSSFNIDEYSHPFIELHICGSEYNGINKCLRKLRYKYWYELLHKKELVSKFTSKLRDKFDSIISDMQDYDFNKFNIERVIKRMNAELVSGVEQEIEVIFDKLTATHSWYPECNGNLHYYNGWATNKAHKLGMKSIIPAYGLFSDSSWSREAFRVHEAYGVLADIEKVFNYLDGCVTAEVDLHNVLERSASMGITRNIQLKYFSVTFYKKGTVHIKFNPEAERIIDAMNIYIGKKRAWLPPYYGKAEYDSYSEEEKVKINEFQGEEKYRTVYANQDMYIYEVPQTNLLMMNA